MKTEYKLPKEFAEKWVKALRSDEYQQGSGELLHIYADGECHYCCLGVAAIVSGISQEAIKNHGDLSDIDEITKPVMPIQFFDDGYRLQMTLMSMNDDDQLSFPTIADWLEENVEFI